MKKNPLTVIDLQCNSQSKTLNRREKCHKWNERKKTKGMGGVKWYKVNEGNSYNWNESGMRGDGTWRIRCKNGTSRIRRKMAQLE